MAATSTAKKSSAAHTMPIEGYDQLSVKAILPHLPGLSGPELRAVTVHEKAGKNRVTLLQAVRKVELAREATASRPAPASHLSVVEELPEPAAASEPTPRSKRTERAPKAKAVPKTTTSPALPPDDEDEDGAQPRSRPGVKAATWEEELRPQLPRRIESASSSYDFEPPTVALVPPVPAAPTSAPRSRPTAPAPTRRKLEGPVLVMAAVLAVLLGLAIGTILARTGPSTAQSGPSSVTTQAAAATTGG